jgi:phage terminase large subunit-like protein
VLTKELLEDERSAGPTYFSNQYQNKPIADEDAHFREEWFAIIKPYDIPTDLRYYIFTDFAFGLDDSNDRTALWVVGLDWERKAYCVDFDVGRWTLNERCRRVIALVHKYNAQAVSMEQMASNEGVKSTILRMRDEYRLKFKLQEIGGRSLESKQMRIVSMQPRFEQRRIFFVERDIMDTIGIRNQYIRQREDGKKDGEIVQEFIRFPRATHDDIPDALSDIDKIDNATKAYFFPGAPPGSAGRPPGKILMQDQYRPYQVRGPSVINGKVLYKWGDPANGRQEAVKKETDFYKRHATRIRTSRP